MTPTEVLKVLIIDGQNNHDMWPKTTMMMKQYLEETGLFSVAIERTAFTWKGEKYLEPFALEGDKVYEALEKPKADPDYELDFSGFDVVLTNFGWNAAALPETTRKNLETFISSGGGLVVVHAADNSWPEWPAFNQMIGLGGWGNRTEKDGPYVYMDESGEVIRDTTPGSAGHHGPQHEFTITIRNPEHPITKGMPTEWLHAQDELYDQLRGPAENIEILASTFSSPEYKGTDRHEPMLMTIAYGEGRIFHTPMGHADYSMECVGFIVSLQRGTEWAATGKVSQTKIPEDFPTADASSKRAFELEN
ncbi:MAG: ThuA domain-containing protein [Bacteroidota bacterium]